MSTQSGNGADRGWPGSRECALVMNGQGDSVREFNGQAKPGIQVKIVTEKPLKAR